MQAKTGGAQAYKHATRKHQIAEDQYFKSLFEIDILEAKLKLLTGPSSKLNSILKPIAQCCDILNNFKPSASDKKSAVRDYQAQVRKNILL